MQESEEVVACASGGRACGEDADAVGKAAGVVGEDLRGGVGRAVVAGEDGDAGERLGEDGVELLAQEALAVEGGEEDLDLSRQGPPQ